MHLVVLNIMLRGGDLLFFSALFFSTGTEIYSKYSEVVQCAFITYAQTTIIMQNMSIDIEALLKQISINEIK